MTILAYLALFGWIPAVIALFALLPGRRAAAVAVVGGWLLLPPYVLPISNFPDYSKNTAATIGMVLGTLIFRPERIMAFRPRWFDLPMLAWCFCGVASSLHNGLGIYDGLSDSLRQIVYWGLPYLLGRIYFDDFEGLRELMSAMAIGGLVYIIPCLWEMRMSPHLLPQIYGFGGWQGIRLGGYRPRVFFGTGLECGMWMTSATLTAWWLWRCGVLQRIAQVPFGMLLAILMATTVLGRSTGALLLLFSGMGLLWVSTRFQTRKLLWALALFGPIYAGIRIPNLWSGEQAVNLVKTVISPDRAQSLEYRFQCEEKLIRKAIQQPVFGWGGWGRSSVYEEYDKMVPTDGMWIVIFGTKGYMGLGLWYLVLQLPTILFLRRVPVSLWNHPRMATAAVGSTIMGICMVDMTMNGFLNLIYVTLAGGLIGITPKNLGVGMPGGRETVALRRADRSGLRKTSPNRTNRQSIASSLDRGSHLALPQVVSPGSNKTVLADRCRSLGRALKAEGRLSEAETLWRQALDLLTDLAAVHPHASDLQRWWCDCANDLVWLQLNHPDPALRDPVSTVALASQVVERCADCGIYWNTLGVAYLRSGDFHLAVAALERAMSLDNGGTAFDDVFLAMAHAQLGELEEARHRLAQAKHRMEQDHPGHPELTRFCDEARSLITEGSESKAAIL